MTRALSAAVAAGRILLPAALVVLVVLAGATGAQTRVEGFGASTAGGGCGVGCTEYVVTNLNNSGVGSLRDAVSAGNRRVTFSEELADLLLAGGEIVLTDPDPPPNEPYDPNIYVLGSNITIDGSTAPSPGITLRGGGLIIRGNKGAHDVIVRGLRIREFPEDGIQITNGASNIVISNVSVWAGPSQTSGDGLIDITEGAHDVTVAWSILGGSGKAMLIKYDASRVTLHNNIWVRARNRNPQVSVDEAGTDATDTTLDMRNNLVYDWIGGGGTTIHHGAQANVVANFYSSPHDLTSDQEQAIIVCRGGGCFDGDPANGALAFTRDNVSGDFLAFDINSVGNASVPFLAPTVTTVDACTAARLTLEGAGARPLDAIDLQFLTPIALPICRRTVTTLTATGSTTTLGTPVTFTATVQARPPAVGTPGGSVTFFQGTVSMGTVALESGVATMVTAELPQGTITVNAVYSGEPNFDVSQGRVKQKVIGSPTSTALTALANPSALGVPVTFTLTATVAALPPSTATPEGSVRFFNGTKLLGTKPLDGGVATLVTPPLPAGFQPVKAQFMGDAGFAASSSAALTLQIDGGTATTLTRTPSSAYTGQTVTFTAKVTSLTGGSVVPAGTVTFRDGAAVLEHVTLDETGTAVLRTSSLPVAKHLVTASYDGSTGFEPSVSPAVATNVAMGGTRTTMTSTLLTLARGQEVTFRVVVTPVAPAAGTPGGSVRFRNGSTTLATRNLSGGVAEFSTTALGVGSHPISVAYDGSSQFKTSVSNKMAVTVTAP